MYPPISFISELGGSLGLFLGISFLSLWELLDALVKMVRNSAAKSMFQ